MISRATVGRAGEHAAFGIGSQFKLHPSGLLCIKLRRSEPVTGPPSSRTHNVEAAQRVQNRALVAISAAERARGVAASSRGGEMLLGGARPVPNTHLTPTAAGLQPQL